MMSQNVMHHLSFTIFVFVCALLGMLYCLFVFYCGCVVCSIAVEFCSLCIVRQWLVSVAGAIDGPATTTKFDDKN